MRSASTSLGMPKDRSLRICSKPLAKVDVGRLHDVLGLPTKALRAALLERTERRRRNSDVFRHCRHCIARGYHSVLHQIEI
jgi:hypothetical protein